jgi:cytidylate kinase
MIITISGHAGSGKSTAAAMLSAATGIPTIDVGSVFRAQARRRKMTLAAFARYAKAHPEIDRRIDQAMLKRARRKANLIWQGRLAGLMAAKAGIPSLKFWLNASPKVRARRVAGRESIPAARALKEILRRDRADRARYRKAYGLDVADMTVYDAVIPTDNRSPEQVVSLLLGSIIHLWQKNSGSPLPRKLRRPQPKDKRRRRR